MAFVLAATLPGTSLPPLSAALATLREALCCEIRLDEDAARGLKAGERGASWCPWPRRTLGLYVDGASTRGLEVALAQEPDGLRVRLALHALASWTDWRLLVELAIAIGDRAGGYVDLQGGGRVSTGALRARYLDDPEQYERDLLAGLDAVRRAVEGGRIVRLGGPRGSVAVGPLLWGRAVRAEDEPEEQAEALLEAVLDSLERKGFESYYPANLLCLDGRTGIELLACLLAPDVDTILRDPEYVLVSLDLEAGPDQPLHVLPFERFEDAFPGLARWLDDRACAVPAIPRADWPRLIERARPLLAPLAAVLDGPDAADADAWRRYVPSRANAHPGKD